MPLFMDVHESLPEGATAKEVAEAHAADLKTQEQYGVQYKKYWVRRGLAQGVLPGRGARRRDGRQGAQGGPRPGGRPHLPGHRGQLRSGGSRGRERSPAP